MLPLACDLHHLYFIGYFVGKVVLLRDRVCGVFPALFVQHTLGGIPCTITKLLAALCDSAVLIRLT